MYLSINTFDPMPFRFEEAFIDRFYGKEKMGDLNKDVDQEEIHNVKQYVGTYRNYDGIAQSNLMKMAILFDETTDTIIKLNNEGSGVGLAIVKTIIDLHGGEIEVMSDKNRTDFCIKLL